MRITRIKAENFRSIRKADIVPFQFNVFVGQNNHGKTNFFEAVEWFYNGSGDPAKIVHLHDNSKDFWVEVEFSNIQAGIETIKNEKNKEAFRKFADGRDVIRVIRRKSDGPKRSLWDEAKGEWSPKTFLQVLTKPLTTVYQDYSMWQLPQDWPMFPSTARRRP